MKNTEKVNEPMTLEKIGQSLNRELTKHFEEWQSGLEYRFVVSAQGYRAKALGMDTGEMADILETEGYIKVVRTPNGKKYVFAGDCPWSLEEMRNWLQEQEILKESQKEFKKQMKAQA